jgi:hypothetical protein
MSQGRHSSLRFYRRTVMSAQHVTKQWGQVLARAWADEVFKQRLLADPATVLRESGIRVPAGLQVCVVEDTEQVCHVILPVRPGPDQLSDEELARAAGGLIRDSSPPPCWPSGQ